MSRSSLVPRFPATASLLLAAAFASSTVATARADAAIPTSSEIASRLSEWRASFVDVQIAWELSRAGADEPFARQEWLWADHGVCLFEDMSLDAERHARMLDVWALPRQASFRALYIKFAGLPERLDRLTIRPVDASGGESPFSVIPLKGVYFPTKSMWISEALNQWLITGVTLEELNGTTCLRIAPRELDGAIIWLDPARDYLVRRYVLPDIPEVRGGFDFTVDEFQQLESGLWFPRRGRNTLFGTSTESQDWLVTRVSGNIAIDEPRLKCPTPVPGTLVTDAVRGKIYRVPYDGTRQVSEDVPSLDQCARSDSRAVRRR